MIPNKRKDFFNFFQTLKDEKLLISSLVKMWCSKLQAVLSFVLFSTVSSNSVVQVVYSLPASAIYTATATNQKVHSLATSNITFTGTHLAGKTNADVMTFLFDGGEIHSTIAQVFVTYPNLATLTYQNNGLFHIKSGSFAQATKLTTLTITLNFLPIIHDHPFKGATALTTLNLNRNRIHKVESTAFSDLTAVTSINLANNHIHHIDLTTFNGLASLTTVILDGNLCPSQTFSSTDATKAPLTTLSAVIGACPK